MDALTSEVIYLVGSILLIIAAVIATASVVVHARVRWRVSVMGRHLMAYMLVVAAVLDLGVLRFFVGDTWLIFVLRTAMYVPVVWVLAWRLWLQIQAQRAERAGHRSTEQTGGT